MFFNALDHFEFSFIVSTIVDYGNRVLILTGRIVSFKTQTLEWMKLLIPTTKFSVRIKHE